MPKFPKFSLILTIVSAILWKGGNAIVNFLTGVQEVIKGWGSGISDIPFITNGLNGVLSGIAGSLNVFVFPLKILSKFSSIVFVVLLLLTILLIIRWVLAKRKNKERMQKIDALPEANNNPQIVVNTSQEQTPAGARVNEADAF